MKFAKYLLTLAFALCAFTSMTKAQTVQLLASGSSALFQELGAASQHTTGISCLWSYAKTTTVGGTPYFAATDARTGVGKDENGPIWIAWGTGGGAGTCASPVAPYDIYVYLSLDSVLGNRCFFEVDTSATPGCTFVIQNAGAIQGGGASGNQVSGFPDTQVDLPPGLITALSGLHFNAAGTDIRPEDAKFATTRMFSACGALIPRQYFNQDSFFLAGLGYGTGNLGTSVSGSSQTGGGSFHVYNYNISGNDPISGNPVPTGWSLDTVGVQPIIVAVAPITDGQVKGMTNITSFTLAELLQGNLGRTNDLLLTSSATGGTEVMSSMIREPLSGTYNTMEFSLPNGTQFHGSQEYGNCSGAAPLQNPLQPLPSGAGVFGPNVGRYRAIGTGKMALCLQSWNTSGVCGSVNNYSVSGGPVLGYLFWSAGNVNAGSSNANGTTPPLTNVKYLTVDGVDPLLDQTAASYTYNGILPGTICGLTGNNCSGDPGLTAVTFAGVNAGNYKIWSPLRLIAASSVSTGASNLLAGLASIDPIQNDYIPVSKLHIWHAHFFINNQNIPVPSDGNVSIGGVNLCSGGTVEQGGDAGGSTMLVQNNNNFCHDFGASTGGFLNKTQ